MLSYDLSFGISLRYTWSGREPRHGPEHGFMTTVKSTSGCSVALYIVKKTHGGLQEVRHIRCV